ncbi:hypothetical protein CABS01_16643 [Colletotrichum abscissum]|uniref:Uncharacterized protein n=1 Tax=Colletotrichum tamarilloi TaxID=1209934 RepID=A0ABQ9QGS7_9PEZI|nr:uncharacterized protein CTAM01_17042 [Colletotrichum tamarilloi]XP_060404540.1 uncharacterized protein CABS01_16643 [Colletotrichum abscissum]KAK1466158.1 hypothetical protein CTAM01_17042 [Colletotrichum tamarilloi]KAK1517415.1 hypothetical protein CABS01_16643 [Colletotrichum abscissum]
MTAPLRAAPTDSIFEQRDPMGRSHTLDPDGGVVLVLENTNPAFALWDQCTTAGLQELNLCQPDSATHPETRARGEHARLTSVSWNSISALKAGPKAEGSFRKLSKKDKRKKRRQEESKSPTVANIDPLQAQQMTLSNTTTLIPIHYATADHTGGLSSGLSPQSSKQDEYGRRVRQ